MGENIEVKDVQKTEYLDKNGLDMLWAKVKENTRNQVEVERNRAVAKEDSITNSLSEFVSKTTTDAQIINSSLGIVGDDKYIQIVESIVDEDPVVATLSPTVLEFSGCDRSTIELNGYDVNSNKGSRITIEAFNENPQIVLNNTSISDTTFQNYLKITKEGISNTDNNANHVYATDGSIADLTQYALSSTLAALEQKVTANTTAISAKQDAGNYIPFDESDESNYKINRPLKYEGYLGKFSFFGDKIFSISNTNKNFSLTDSSISYHIGRMGISLSTQGFNVTEDGNFDINIDSTSIQLGKTANPNVMINANGISLPNGDNNHVLTSNASTIDITQYVLKSVYDEKIAALEARIAALEAAA